MSTKKNVYAYYKSFLTKEVTESCCTNYNPYLEVAYEAGKYLLNSKNVNYSFGGLHKAFEDTFKEFNIPKMNIRNVLVLGLGAGSVPSILNQLNLNCTIIGVEIDPKVIELGNKYFQLNEFDNLSIIQDDAIRYVEGMKDIYDLITVDLFIDSHVPVGAETPQFLKKIQNHLSDNGLVIYNRIVIDDKTKESTYRFHKKFLLIYPNAQIYYTLVNHMYIAEKKSSTSI